MMKKRTKEEIKAIVRRCVEIEKAGGNVVDYLRSEHYVSPGATWINLQREFLHRKWPKNGETEKFILTHEMRESAINMAIGGYDPRPYLRECGSEDPFQVWLRIRKELKKEDYDRWALLPAKISKKTNSGSE